MGRTAEKKKMGKKIGSNRKKTLQYNTMNKLSAVHSYAASDKELIPVLGTLWKFAYARMDSSTLY